MISLKVEEKLKQYCPDVRLGIIQCKVETLENCSELWVEIDKTIKKKERELTMEQTRQISSIESSRLAYKAVGKDPSRYRLSAEALLRRIVNGKGLYKINNVVDLLNLVSIESGFSIGGYNADAITGDVRFGIGKANEAYEGIGRGALNIENLPIFRDNLGAFGSPTSDSVRTSIASECTHFLMVIISFQADNGLQNAMDLATDLLEKYANASNIETKII